jgi:hypothetical protein
MARTLINGAQQIQSGSIPWAAMASGAIVPTASLVDGANFLKKDGSVTLTASLNLGGFNATNAADAVNAGDLVTKRQLDAKVSGVGGIHEARVVAVANSALTGLLTIDGVTLVANDIVLLTAQTTASQSGPWVAASGSWTRPAWWAGASSITENQYFLIGPDGTSYKSTKWWMSTTGTITVDTTSIAFTQDQSGVSYTNGTGLSLAGNVFSVNYGTTSATAAQGNDSRITGALQTSSLGTSVQTALGVNVGTAGAVVVNGGALGTPSGGTLTSCTGLPISTGVSGLGTGVATALAAATNAGSGLAVLSSGVLAAGQFPALTGDVTTTAGSLTTTINHTSGSGFIKYGDFVDNETPTGAMNGSNTTFTLANTPANSSLRLYYEGSLLEPGSGNDYTLSGATITMLFAPPSTDKMRAYYRK